MIVSKKSWHYKLLNFLGWIPYYTTSLCPYFWKLVAALTLTVGVVPYLAMGIGLDAYVIFSPAIDTIITEANVITEATMTEAGEEYKAADDGMGPHTALMILWGVNNAFLSVFIFISMLLAVICWLCIGAAVGMAILIGLKIAFEALNDKTHIGTKVGETVGSVIAQPARATGSVFSAWWRAHKEKHCPLIEFVEDD